MLLSPYLLYGKVGRADMAAESRPPVFCFLRNKAPRLIPLCRRNHWTKLRTTNKKLKVRNEMNICWKKELLSLESGIPDGGLAVLLLDMATVFRIGGDAEKNIETLT
jgi:hypothetical protein